MDDDNLDERLREIARGYNEPPDPPREAMWEAIQKGRRAAGPARRAPRWQPRWVPVAAAAAAVLATGIGIGRLTSGLDERAPVATVPAPEAGAASATAYRLAATEHLGQSEAFLTLFRSAVAQGTDHRLASATARRLLATSRLLMDSPAADDRRLRLLLEDLELVLAGIAQLSPQSPEGDLELVRETIERGDVLPRLRTAVPSGAGPIQGAL
jgi:hypothetical protein